MKPGLFRNKPVRVLLIFLLVSAVTFLVFTALRGVFQITVIKVVGTDIAVEIDEKRISKNLLFFPSERFRDEILHNNPFLKDVQFKKNFPNTLLIVPFTRPPFAQITSGDKDATLDAEGFVLMHGVDASGLPKIVLTTSQFRVGKKIDDLRVITALAILRKFEGLYAVKSIIGQDGPYLLVKTDKIDILIPENCDTDEILATLQTLLAGFRIKGTLPAVVDLRFDKPVVTF